jgi:putative ABC transport system permease protein
MMIMESILQDIRYGVRVLLKRPAFTIVAVATLALGIGANTAIFSVVNAVLLRTLPYQEPERLVALWETNAQPEREVNNRNEVAMGNFRDWRTQQSVFDEIAALTYSNVNLTGIAEPERIQGAVVTTNLFQVLGVQPFAGRGFLAEEENPESPRTVIVSHGLWQRRFGSDPDIVGKTLALNGNQVTVVGIMPPAFELEFPSTRHVEMWMPMRIAASNTDRQSHYLYVVGRLKPAVSLEQARAGMNVLAGQLQQQYPKTNSDRGANVVPLQQQLVGNVRPYLRVLFAAVGFVLLIACANVASLLLTRVTARHREVAIRMAIGASRWRIIRQLLTESVLLSTFGGVGGLLLAYWQTDLLVALTPPDVPRLSEIGLHGPVFAWTLGISIITGVLFGLAPALGASKPDLNESLKESGRSIAGPGRSRMRNLLVISEIALALVLLIGAGLMVRSFARLQHVSPGFDPKNLLTMNISLARQKYRENQQINSFFDQLLERVRSVPGVEAVGGIDPLPFSNSDGTTGFVVEGAPPLAVGDRPEVGERTITPDYFHTMRIPLLKGRAFSERDREDAPRVVIINEALARRFWPNEEAIGKRLGFRASEPQIWHEIVGIVGNVKHKSLDADPKPELYFPYSQYPSSFMTLVVRTPSEPVQAISAIRNQVLGLDSDQPVFDIKTMDERLSKAVAPSRFVMLLLSAFAALAMLLAAVGIYGVMAYTVSQRTHEIGVRMALGAAAPDVMKLVVGHGLKLVLAGVGMGIAGAIALTRLMESLLFEVSATDPLTFALISAVLTGVALAACFVPARRATKVDPMIALRYE